MTTTNVLPAQRRPTRLVLVGSGLWVADRTGREIETESLQQRVARSLAKRAIFARPLFPKSARPPVPPKNMPDAASSDVTPQSRTTRMRLEEVE